MHKYLATVSWKDHEKAFESGRYSRAHTWSFDGGITVEASSSPFVVRAPYSKEEAVDPEEAFIASLSSCHLLTFLYLVYKKGFVVREYTDEATGVMGKNEANKDWVSAVELNPVVVFEGKQPSREELEALHEAAHEECYIANSVKTAVKVIIPD